NEIIAAAAFAFVSVGNRNLSKRTSNGLFIVTAKQGIGLEMHADQEQCLIAIIENWGYGGWGLWRVLIMQEMLSI
ncbi:MAG: hypothetical protein AAGU02_06330, partial [Lawsonibacter sp.]